MSPKKPLRKPSAAYLRLSIAGEDSTSIASQRALVREEAQRRGWAEPDLFIDEGVSGSKDIKRPARDDLERRLAAGEFSALICKSVDRLARSSADFARLAKLCRDTGTALLVTDLNVDSSTPAGAMILGVLAQLAEFEAALIGARVRAGNVEKIRQGRALAGPVPFHLRNVPRVGGGKARAVDPAKATVAKEIVARLISGESFRAIAIDLNGRGVAAPRKGTAWTSGTVRQIATNPALAGMSRRLGDVVRGDDGLPVVDAATAIVDLATWERLRAVVEGRSTKWKPRLVEGERLLLDGLAICEACGSRMHRSTTQGKYVSYSCSRGVRGACTSRASISAAILDAHVADAYLEGIGDEEVVETHREVDPAVSEERVLIRADVAALTAAIATAGAAEIHDLAARLADLRRREDALRDEEPLAVMRRTGETYRARWGRSDHAERRHLLAEAVASVRVAKGSGTDRVEVRFGW